MLSRRESRAAGLAAWQPTRCENDGQRRSCGAYSTESRPALYANLARRNPAVMKFICGNFALGLVLALRTASSHATVFELPADGSAVIGADTVVSTHYEDTLLDIARKDSLG